MQVRSPSHVLGIFLVGAALAVAPEVHADSGNVGKAAAEYEAGRVAFKERRYSDAARHFEGAYAEVPSAQALRNAIRARREAHEDERAATLAALGEKNYSNDPPTMVLVRDVLSSSTNLGRVDIECTPACTIRVDGSTVEIAEDPTEEHHIYTRPGTRNIEARFPGRGNQAQSLEIKPGGVEQWKAEPEGEGGGDGNGKSNGNGNGKGDKGDKGGKNAPEDDRPFPKGVFYGGVAISALMLIVTIGSYIDLKRVESDELKVTKECKDDPTAGDDCFPTGEVSKSARGRTYIVGGVTAGLVIGTAVVGAFFTRWGKDPAPQKSGNSRLEPFVVPMRQGAAFGLSGAF
jgi:hypothetical protein